MAKNSSVAIQVATEAPTHDPLYEEYLQQLQREFEARVSGGETPLFTTDAAGLFEAYLAAIPGDERQYYHCHACRDFIQRFGGLVTIDAEGRAEPLFWDEAGVPALLREATAAAGRIVRRAQVTGVFLTSEKSWGKAVTGPWHHLAVVPPEALIYRGGLKNAGQTSAEKHEDFGQVIRALDDFSLGVLQLAVRLLESEQLYRGEKILGGVRWLRDLQEARSKARGTAKANLVWRAVALAPAGFCHPRSGMAGTLLDDLAAGLSYETVAERFAKKMHPLQYQRPQAAPAAGNIEQAEKVIAQLGLSSALKRRFARLEEVETLWSPAPAAPLRSEAGVFGHLKAKESGSAVPTLQTPAVTLTWEKFRRTVLPGALAIEFYVPGGRQSFMALVTATDPEAPPLLQWDSPDQRNPVSWYFWNGGSLPSQWGLVECVFRPVVAVALYPPMWGGAEDRFQHHGQGVTLFLDGMRESQNGGLGLFPEMLRAELHGVRATLEAFSRAGELEGMAEGSACGIGFKSGGTWGARLRVRSESGVTEYELDRWD